MRIERRITFIIAEEGFPTWKINRLKTLSHFFRSVIILQNISIAESANTAHTLEILSIGCKKNDLCQLWIEGADAELACMVLTDFIDQHFSIVNTSHKKNENKTNSIIANHPSFHLTFILNYSFDVIEIDEHIKKSDVISLLSQFFAEPLSGLIENAFMQRESLSSTAVGNNIAIPHVMLREISQPSIVVRRLNRTLHWGSNLGDVKMIIAILIPFPAPVEMIKSITKLTRALIEPYNCKLITTNTEAEAIKAILFHFMSLQNQHSLK